jgi:pimeloyl-ACP methyl ester carboxylesterase
MFASQVAALRDQYRCVTFDFRGHGGSELTETGYDMDSLSNDAAAFIEKLDVGPVHFVGFSIGGFAGLRLAVQRQTLLRSLTLIGAAAIDGRDSSFTFKMLPFLSATFGMCPVTGSMMSYFFSPAFLEDPARQAEREKWERYIRSNRALGVSRAASGAIAQTSILPKLGKVHVPALVIRGELDGLIKEDVAKQTAAAISNARFVSIPKRGHVCNIEDPASTNAAIMDFLTGVSRL